MERVHLTGAVSTRSFALSSAEWVTTALAVTVSTSAYLVGGFAYLARGVVGDLTGFVVLAVGGALLRARLRHEALLCLLLIGGVVLAAPRWPLAAGVGRGGMVDRVLRRAGRLRRGTAPALRLRRRRAQTAKDP